MGVKVNVKANKRVVYRRQDGYERDRTILWNLAKLREGYGTYLAEVGIMYLLC